MIDPDTRRRISLLIYFDSLLIFLILANSVSIEMLIRERCVVSIDPHHSASAVELMQLIVGLLFFCKEHSVQKKRRLSTFDNHLIHADAIDCTSVLEVGVTNL